MNEITIRGLLTVVTICSFCHKSFEVIKRHTWRCKEKLNHHRNEGIEGNHGNDNVLLNAEVNLNRNDIANNNSPKCICGRICKGLRGLKAHQRSCRSITSLKDENTVDNENINKQHVMNNQFATANNNDKDESPSLKEGIKLPKSPEDWRLANMYFHSELSKINIKGNLFSCLFLMIKLDVERLKLIA